MPAANDLRKGMAIKYNGNPAIVLEVHHRTPGNLRAFVQAIIRYINTGKSADVRFGSTDKVELVDIERKQLEFSYKDRNGYHFMDPETYDTITLTENFIGQASDYLVENLSVQVLYAEGKAVEVELPASVSLKVVESAEGLRGDTASNVAQARTWAARNAGHYSTVAQPLRLPSLAGEAPALQISRMFAQSTVHSCIGLCNSA
jgi:elongation factor P